MIGLGFGIEIAKRDGGEAQRARANRCNARFAPKLAWVTILAAALLGCEDKDILPDAIETPPLAAFTYDVTPNETGVTVTVDASTSTDAQDPLASLRVRWDWEADGSWDTEYASAKTASHSYDSMDSRTIRLEVIDTAGLRGVTSQLATFVAPLSCVVTALPLSGTSPLAVDFASAVFGGTGAYAFKWRFGDGATSAEQNPSHTFSGSGTFEAVFTLTDAGLPGQACRDTARIVVTAEPR